MKDTVSRALVLDQRVKIIVATTTELVAEAAKVHQLWPTSATALGRTLSMGAIMGVQLKNEDEMLTIKIDGDGELGSVRVDANKQGHVKGYVKNPEVLLVKEDTYKLDVGKAIGKGTLSVSRNYGLKNEYTSTIDLVSGEIGEDFAYYYLQSEQLPSAVSVGVLVDPDGKIQSAGAMLIQMLPDHTEEDILIVEDIVRNLKPMSSLVLEGYTSESLIHTLFEDAQILETKDIKFECDCDRDQMERVLLTLPVDDLLELKKEDKGINLECQFCAKHYFFNEDEIDAIIEKINHGKNS